MSTRGWRPARMLMLTALAAAALPGATAAAADPPACPPPGAHGVRLAADLPTEVVFGRAVTVGATVGSGVTDARLELRTTAGTLLAASTAVTPSGAMRIAELPAPRGGTTAIVARVTATAPDGGAGCRTTDERTIRLVPGRLGRLRVDDRGGIELTIRTAAGEGCQDYLRASTVQVRLTDVTAGRAATEVLESVHPCDGWTVRTGSRLRRIEIEPRDANLVLCARRGAVTGRFRLTITRSGSVVARGTVLVTGTRVGYRPDGRRAG